MKGSLFIISKYIRSHKGRFISLVICISLFITAIITVMWYNDSFKYSENEKYKQKNGAYALIDYYVNEDIVSENKKELTNENAGLLKGYWSLNSDDQNITIGYADENAAGLIPITMRQGRLPQNQDEAAIEKLTYDLLGLKADIGDRVSFEIKDSSGNTITKEFILTGITDNFFRSLREKYNGSQRISIPTILIGDEDIAPLYVHIVAGEDTFLTRNLESESTYSSWADSQQMQTKIRVNNIIFIPLTLFFVITSVVGIFSVSSYFFKDIEKHLRLLRCIGFSKKKAKKMILIYILIFWLLSLIISILISALILFILHWISSYSSRSLLISAGTVPFLCAAMASALIITVSFFVQLKKFYKKSPVREEIYTTKKSRKSRTELKKCCHNAYGRKNRIEKITCITMIFLCVGMSVFGSFLPLFNARGTTWADPDFFTDDRDYSLHMTGGGGNSDSFYIQFPSGSGINRKAADKLLSDSSIEVEEASVYNLCHPFFLTSSKSPENRYIEQHFIDAAEKKIDPLFRNKKTSEMIKLAGGNAEKDCIIDLPVRWLSKKCVEKNINITNGSFDMDEFNSGKGIIAPDSLCSVGDVFTMIIPIPDKNATEENIYEHISFECTQIKVTSTYDAVKADMNDLVVSLDYLFSVYPDLNYEELVLKNTDKSNIEKTTEIEDQLEFVLSLSGDDVELYNYSEMAKEFYDDVNAQTFQLILSIFVFVIMIITAVVFSNYIQVRSNIMSYAVMRAIGARVGVIRRLILSEAHRILIIGTITGTAAGWGISLFFAYVARNIKTWDIFLFYVMPVFILTVVLLYIGSHIAIKRAVRSLIDENIIERLNTADI